jgi:hypothetical protein
MMPSQKTRTTLILAFVAGTVVVSSVLFFGYPEVLRRHVLRPAIQAYYIVRFYLEFVPQIVLWLLPPVVVTAIAVHRLLRKHRPAGRRAPSAVPGITPEAGELSLLIRQIHRAHYSRFARVRLSRSLMEIGSRLIAGREGTSLEAARRMLAEGYWRDRRSVHQFLIPRRHYTTHQSSQEFDQALRETIDHLETFEREM